MAHRSYIGFVLGLLILSGMAFAMKQGATDFTVTPTINGVSVEAVNHKMVAGG